MTHERLATIGKRDRVALERRSVIPYGRWNKWQSYNPLKVAYLDQVIDLVGRRAP